MMQVAPYTEMPVAPGGSDVEARYTRDTLLRARPECISRPPSIPQSRLCLRRHDLCHVPPAPVAGGGSDHEMKRYCCTSLVRRRIPLVRTML